MAMLSQQIEPTKTPTITQERLKYFLTYDPDTGIFTWNIDYFRVKKGDKLTSTITDGKSTSKTYRRVKLDKRTYKLSRLAFLYMTGKFPTQYVDHINGDSLDDRWYNLREATPLENSRNSKVPSNNSSGIKGLSRVRINRNIYLCCNISGTVKYFKPEQEQEAIVWLEDTRNKLHGDFSNHG